MFKVGDVVVRDLQQEHGNWKRNCEQLGLPPDGRVTVKSVWKSGDKCTFNEVGGIWYTSRYIKVKRVKRRIV